MIIDFQNVFGDDQVTIMSVSSQLNYFCKLNIIFIYFKLVKTSKLEFLQMFFADIPFSFYDFCCFFVVRHRFILFWLCNYLLWPLFVVIKINAWKQGKKSNAIEHID